MAKTPRMQWPVPGQHLDPWYDAFVAMMGEVDADAFAAREDRNILLTGGGTISFSTMTGVLSWSAAIELVAPTGFLLTIDTGNITLAEGEVLYVVIPRGAAAGATLTPAKTTNISALPNHRDVLALAVRRLNAVWWRTGPFGGGGSGGAGTDPRLTIAMATNEATGENTNQTVGAFQLNPSDYTYSPITFFFVTLGSVSAATFTGRISLFNLTTATNVLNHDYTATATSRQRTSFVPTAGNNIYEIRIRTTTGVPPNDKIFAWWAGIEIEKV